MNSHKDQSRKKSLYYLLLSSVRRNIAILDNLTTNQKIVEKLEILEDENDWVIHFSHNFENKSITVGKSEFKFYQTRQPDSMEINPGKSNLELADFIVKELITNIGIKSDDLKESKFSWLSNSWYGNFYLLYSIFVLKYSQNIVFRNIILIIISIWLIKIFRPSKKLIINLVIASFILIVFNLESQYQVAKSVEIILFYVVLMEYVNILFYKFHLFVINNR